MLLFHEPVERGDLLFVAFMTLCTAVLFFMPTGYEKALTDNSMRTSALILETDNRGVHQFGVVKTGDQEVRARVLQGRFKGQEIEAVNTLLGKLEMDKMFAPGDRALAVLDLDPSGTRIIHATLVDHYRLDVELILFGLFTLMLVLFAGWTGFKALLSFAFTALMIWKVMLPAFLSDWLPIPISLGVVTLLTGGIIFLVAGLTRKGVVAFLGALAGILVTCLLSMVCGGAFRLHGAVRPFSETLLYSGYPHLDLRGIFLAGVFLASSGAVMDMAMDVAASMKEVADRNPDISRLELIRSGFRVGRAVIGTMTTTLLLAYSGGFTAMLMLFMARGIPMINIFNLTYVSAEILHTLVGSFGLVTVAPFTALVGGLLYTGGPPQPCPEG